MKNGQRGRRRDLALVRLPEKSEFESDWVWKRVGDEHLSRSSCGKSVLLFAARCDAEIAAQVKMIEEVLFSSLGPRRRRQRQSKATVRSASTGVAEAMRCRVSRAALQSSKRATRVVLAMSVARGTESSPFSSHRETSWNSLTSASATPTASGTAAASTTPPLPSSPRRKASKKRKARQPASPRRTRIPSSSSSSSSCSSSSSSTSVQRRKRNLPSLSSSGTVGNAASSRAHNRNCKCIDASRTEQLVYRAVEALDSTLPTQRACREMWSVYILPALECVRCNAKEGGAVRPLLRLLRAMVNACRRSKTQQALIQAQVAIHHDDIVSVLDEVSLRELQPIPMSSLMHAIATLKLVPNEKFAVAWARRMARCIRMIPRRTPPRALATSVWALATIFSTSESGDRASRKQDFARIGANDATAAAAVSKQNESKTRAAMGNATLDGRVGAPRDVALFGALALEKLEHASRARVAGDEDAQRIGAQETVMWFWGAVRLRLEVSQEASNAVQALFVNTSHEFSAQGLATLLWSFATLQERQSLSLSSASSLPSSAAARFMSSGRGRGSDGKSAIVGDAFLMKWMERFVKVGHASSAQALANCAWALARLRVAFSGDALLTWQDAFDKRANEARFCAGSSSMASVEAVTATTTMSTQTVANALHAFADGKWKMRSKTMRVVDRVVCNSVSRFSGDELCALLWAAGQLSVSAETGADGGYVDVLEKRSVRFLVEEWGNTKAMDASGRHLATVARAVAVLINSGAVDELETIERWRNAWVRRSMEVLKFRKSRGGLAFGGTELAMVLYAAAKCDSLGCKLGTEWWKAVETRFKKVDEKSADARCTSIVAWSIATAYTRTCGQQPHGEPRSGTGDKEDALDFEVRTGEEQDEEGQELVSSQHGGAKWDESTRQEWFKARWRSDDARVRVFRVWVRWYEARRGEYSADELVNCLWAAAKLKLSLPHTLARDCEVAMIGIGSKDDGSTSESTPPLWASLGAEQLCAVLWAYGTLQKRPSRAFLNAWNTRFLDLLQHLTCHDEGNAGRVAWMISSVLWAMARLRRRPSVRTLRACHDAFSKVAHNSSPQALACIAWAHASLRLPITTRTIASSSSFASSVSSASLALPSFPATATVEVARASSTRAVVAEAAGAWCDAIRKMCLRTRDGSEGRGFSGHELVDVVWALGRYRLSATSDLWDDAMRAMVRRDPVEFDGTPVVNALWAVARCRAHLITREQCEWFEAVLLRHIVGDSSGGAEAEKHVEGGRTTRGRRSLSGGDVCTALLALANTDYAPSTRFLGVVAPRLARLMEEDKLMASEIMVCAKAVDLLESTEALDVLRRALERHGQQESRGSVETRGYCNAKATSATKASKTKRPVQPLALSPSNTRSKKGAPASSPKKPSKARNHTNRRSSPMRQRI